MGDLFSDAHYQGEKAAAEHDLAALHAIPRSQLGATDRIGLLYDLTRTLAGLGLDVHVAKVATYTGRVIDAFYVRDAVGRKVTDPEDVAVIERSMRALLG